MAKPKSKSTRTKSKSPRTPRKKPSGVNLFSDPRFLGITAIVIIALVALVLIKPLFVGKAVETAEGNRLDLFYENGQLWVEITSFQAVNGVSFDLLSDAFPCGSLLFRSNLNWEYREISCNDGRHTYGTASLVDSIRGTITVAISNVTSAFPANFSLRLENIGVYSEGNDLFTNEADSGDFTFSTRLETAEEEDVPVATESSTSEGSAPSGGAGGGGGSGSGGSGSGGGKSLTCTRNWECGDWSACSQGQQSRICRDLNNCAPTKNLNGRTYPVVLLGSEKPVETRLCEEIATAPAREEASKIEKPVLMKVPTLVKTTSKIQPEVKAETKNLNKLVVGVGVLAVLAVLAGVLVHHFRRPRAVIVK